MKMINPMHKTKKVIENKFFPFLLLMVVLVTSVILITGCGVIEETKYNFNGKLYTESQLEEVIESLIELENPDCDFDADILVDTD